MTLDINGTIVPNFALLTHSDIDTSDDVEDVGGNLVCRTNLTTCCRGGDGLAQGFWYYPTGAIALFGFEGPLPGGQIYRYRRGAQVVRLRREVNSAATANGIYRCELADQNGVTQTRYVGLYTEGAGECRFVKHVECVIFVYNMLSSTNCRLFLSCRCGINI